MPSEAALRKFLRDRWCRLCSRPAESTHHVLYKSHGGEDTPDALVPLCGSGTTGCHGKIHAHDRAARRLLAERLRPEERAYIASKLVHEDVDHWIARVYGGEK